MLMALFPRFKSLWSTSAENRDEAWLQEKRVASYHYFDRFFSYGIPIRDLADREVSSFLGSLNSGAAMTSSDLKAFIDKSSADKLLRKLRQFADELTPDGAERLAILLAQSGTYFLEREGEVLFGAFTEAGLLVEHFINRVPAGERRSNAAARVVIEAQPIDFAVECLRWIRTATEEGDEHLLAKEQIPVLMRSLVDRSVVDCRRAPLFKTNPRAAGGLYTLWAEHGDKEALRTHVRTAIGDDPERAEQFLSCYAFDFRFPDRRPYDSLALAVDPQVIYDLLQKKYGDGLLGKPQIMDGNTVKNQALTFAAIHRSVSAQQPKTPTA
jgi:hypothetical protein